MSESIPRDFRAGLTWSFAAEQLDDVVDAVARLPEEYQDACVFSSGRVEFDVEFRAQSFDDAKRIVGEQILRVVKDAGVPGHPESASATDDVSWASWRFVDDRLAALP